MEALAKELGVLCYHPARACPDGTSPAAVPGEDEGRQRQRVARPRHDLAWTTTSSSSSTSTTGLVATISTTFLAISDDPKIAWVQAPSVCGTSTTGPLVVWPSRTCSSRARCRWASTVRLAHAVHHRLAHVTYRTAADPRDRRLPSTRAEDHLDTVVLAANGYQGVFVPDPIAVGDGPHDFATYLRQQFAWAHSMIQIFLRHTPRLSSGATRPSQAIQFLMCQSWYTLCSVARHPLGTADRGADHAHRRSPASPSGRFLVFFLPLPLMALGMWLWARRWFQPSGLQTLLARHAARDRPLAGRGLGADQRPPRHQPELHDHPEGRRAARGPAAAEHLRTVCRPHNRAPRGRVGLVLAGYPGRCAVTTAWPCSTACSEDCCS